MKPDVRLGWYFEGDDSENCCADPEQVLFDVPGGNPLALGGEAVVVIREEAYNTLLQEARKVAGHPVDIYGSACVTAGELNLMGLRRALLRFPPSPHAGPRPPESQEVPE